MVLSKAISVADFYFVTTPVHHVLALGLALQEPNTEKILVAFTRTDAEQAWSEQLSQTRDWPFAVVVRLSRQLAKGSTFQKLATIRHNCKAIRQLITDHAPRKIFFFNDGFPAVQAACVFSKERNPTVERIFVDEGMSSYGIRPSKVPTRLSQALRRLAFGAWWQDIPMSGCSPYVDRALLMFPSNANPSMIGCKEQLDPSIFRSDRIRSIANQVAQDTRLGPVQALVLPTRLSLVPDAAAYAAEIDLLIESLLLEQTQILVKHHPAEDVDDPFHLADRYGISVAKRTTPSETIVLSVSATIRRIFGDTSSAILTAKWLCPHVDAVALLPADSSSRSDDREKIELLFQRAGVRCAESVVHAIERST